MRACIHRAYGSPDLLSLGDAVTPEARPDELLIAIRATAVTSADGRFRASAFPPGFLLLGRMMLGLFRPRNPILGMDFSGVVVATGQAVTRFRVGDEVFGATSPFRRGAHAEYLTISESGVVVHKPAALTHAQAAATPFGGCAALAFLRDFGRVRPGQRVLVIGASGGVGVWAVQIARHLGAEVVGVCSARNAALVSSLGAHQVVDYAEGNVAPEGAGYDVILDTVGVTTYAECRAALTAEGVYLPLVGGPREMWQALTTSLRRGRRLKYAVSSNTREGLETLVDLVTSGAAVPVVDHVYPMSRFADAHRHVDGRHKRGSVIVEVEGPRAAGDAAARPSGR